MKLETKKTIAKEGLILLGVILLAAVTFEFFARGYGNPFPRFIKITLLHCFIYASIRFVIWAIKTLNIKSGNK